MTHTVSTHSVSDTLWPKIDPYGVRHRMAEKALSGV